MSKAIEFFREYDTYGELSNYYVPKTILVYKGKTYKTSEHLFQALKYIHDDSTKVELEYAEVVRNVNTANKARILANQDKGGGYKWRTDLNPIIAKYEALGAQIKEDWDDVKIGVMKDVLRIKFKTDAHCKKVLLSTAPHPLIEKSPFDSFWGAGKDGKGTNHLGRLLVQVRDELLEENKETTKRKAEETNEKPKKNTKQKT